MTTVPITAEEMRGYLDTARRTWQAEREQRLVRRVRAWELARQAATLLKAKFNVDRVVVFGSLIHPDRFTRWSDVDLAAWELTSANWLKAIGAVRALSDEIEINLVDITCCSPELSDVIGREGVPL